MYATLIVGVCEVCNHKEEHLEYNRIENVEEYLHEISLVCLRCGNRIRNLKIEEIEL